MYPEDISYHPGHGWVRFEEGKAVCGITWFAQDQLGEILYIELPEPGTELVVGATYGSVESSKSVSDLVAPISGKITAVNDDAAETPELANDDPYGTGWLIEVEPGGEENDELMDAAAYKSLYCL